ncbi:hypothetical protein HYPSUDRAFT_1059497 [Hypholoma sublateritium FD-334 SS-4]|uniref:Uncharacterized protein n=1 Tax=Hypholoma sublateritium (strain FD-334 SS-4) TaxID=945553 RepID=A0A0D2P8Q8_HYPSF|nr:hypothetical protein HYPSUDRAFT_1059497 [Hypholoma sublateritium FD-334 SS-4]
MSTELYLYNIFNNREPDDEPPSSESDESEPDISTPPLGSEEVNWEAHSETPLESELATNIKETLIWMDSRGLSLVKFLNGLSWGDAACTQDPKIRYERTSLLRDPQLAVILQRWISPPRPLKSKKKQPEGASPMMKQFVFEYSKKTLSDELEKLAPYLLSSTKDDVQTERLVSTTFEEFGTDMQEVAPFLWGVLEHLTIPLNLKKF